MRSFALRAFAVCCLAGVVVLVCGCGIRGGSPQVRLDGKSFKRVAWVRVADAHGDVVGYLEKCRYSERSPRNLTFVYNTRLTKIGFITPAGVGYRYNPDGSSTKLGLFPEGGAENAILHVEGDLQFLAPGKEPRRLKRKKKSASGG